jgi:arylsulfatase A-like enzyme
MLTAIRRRLRFSLVTLAFGMLGCQLASQEEDSAFFFVDNAHRAKISIDGRVIRNFPRKLRETFTLTGVTRRALAPPLSVRVSFDLEVPPEPVLRFAIGASTMDNPTLLAPVEFLVLVDAEGSETVVFSETVRRSKPNQWFPREVDLSPWTNSQISLSFETKRAASGRPSADKHILPLWGNPTLSSRAASPAGPNMILISVDCLRADHVGAYGYERDTTPGIDAFAEESAVYETAIATSSFTLPTHASMLTGLPPSIHGATVRSMIPRSVPYLPELLAEAGYRVNAVVSAAFLAPSYGFSRGFHTYEHSSGKAANLVDDAIALLREGEGQSQFLFLHLFDIHWPYTPPRELISRFEERPNDISSLLERVERRETPRSAEEIEQIVGLYDGAILYVDQELSRFFEALQDLQLYDKSLIVLTADHGEAFYEHDHWEHARPWLHDGPGLYEEVIHIPLIVKWPGQASGARIGNVVSQGDIFPTLLEAAGLKSPNGWTCSLRRYLEGTPDVPRRHPVIAEFTAFSKHNGASMQVALRSKHYKYIATLRSDVLDEIYSGGIDEEELYDMAADPGETRNLIGESGIDVGRYRRALRAYLEEAEKSRLQRRGQEVNLDEANRDRLKELGYIEK